MPDEDKKPLDNAEGLKKDPADVEKDAAAAREGASPVGLAGNRIVGVDPARAPMQDERKELAHSTLVEGEREQAAADMRKRAGMHAEAMADKSKQSI